MAESEAAVRQNQPVQQGSKEGSDSLEDRIRYGRVGSIAQQIAIALQVGRLLRQLHGQRKAHGALTARHVLVDANDSVSLLGGGEQEAEARARTEDTEAFGRLLYEILSGEVQRQTSAPEQPEIEQLHKAGIPPKLIEVTVRCLESPGSGDLGRAVRILESELRNLVEPKQSAYEPTQLVVAALGAITLAATLVWIAVS
jgi:hypothetical protein